MLGILSYMHNHIHDWYTLFFVFFLPQAEGMFCVFYGDSYQWCFTWLIVVIDYDDCCMAMRLDCMLGFL